MTLAQAGEYLGRNASSVSRAESGEVPARIGDVVALMNLYGVDDHDERIGLETLAREVWQKGWLDPYRKTLSTDFIDYAWMEARASEVRSFDGLVLAGLLQTRAYAEATSRAVNPEEPEESFKQSIEYRMERQRVLDRQQPFLFRSIIDEGVLHRPVGGAEVMATQLARLIELADHDRVEVRVLPFEAGAHAAVEGAFQVFTQPYPYAVVGYAETLGGSIYVEADEAERFVRAYDLLETAALDPRESIARIATLQKDLE